jgi:hypothetical protein
MSNIRTCWFNAYISDEIIHLCFVPNCCDNDEYYVEVTEELINSITNIVNTEITNTNIIRRLNGQKKIYTNGVEFKASFCSYDGHGASSTLVFAKADDELSVLQDILNNSEEDVYNVVEDYLRFIPEEVA